MCQSLQVLSQRRSQRFVATCEHATFHLRWKQAMLLIHPESFGQLLELMERRAECTLERAVRVGCMGLYFLPNGMLQLWIADTGLALQPIEAELLAELLEEAEALRHTPTSHDAAIGSALNHTREYRMYEQPQIGGARLN